MMLPPYFPGVLPFVLPFFLLRFVNAPLRCRHPAIPGIWGIHREDRISQLLSEAIPADTETVDFEVVD